MSVYNGLPFLPSAVNSILQQTLKDLTLLIVNDGSTDGTREFLERIDDSRVRIVNQPNQGLGGALNVGLAMCETEFLARMDADDIALPNRIETQLRFLRQHSEVGTVGSQFAYLGENGRTGFSPQLPCDHETIYADLLRVRHALCHATILCRTALLKQIGGYRIRGVGQDWDMMLRIGELARLANVDRVLYLYRLHQKSANATKLQEMQVAHAYASHNAKCRAAKRTAPSLTEFTASRPAESLWRRIAGRADRYAFSQYRQALLDVLSGRKVTGYARLGWAAICSPQRTTPRIRRLAQRLFQKNSRIPASA
jgi:glycosyltransferase involved in cell wall biosynthesis